MSTLLKHIRIPEDVCREIDKAAEKNNTDFSKESIYRLKHYERPLTPGITAKVQDIVNKAEELVGEYAPKEIDKLKMESIELWEYMK